MLNFSSSVV